MQIKISAKSCREQWNGCQIEYIQNVCHGRCCVDGAGHSHIAILPEEAEAITTLGENVIDGMLENAPGGGCPFWCGGFCEIHDIGHKPLTCWASPFTLNKNNTLIVKNRNRKLICYKKEPNLPTYKAYIRSLVELFGEYAASVINETLDAGSGDFYIEIDDQRISKIRWLIAKTRRSVGLDV